MAVRCTSRHEICRAWRFSTLYATSRATQSATDRGHHATCIAMRISNVASLRASLRPWCFAWRVTWWSAMLFVCYFFFWLSWRKSNLIPNLEPLPKNYKWLFNIKKIVFPIFVSETGQTGDGRDHLKG